MAHELTTREDGTVEMAYTGDTPWHGLGNVLEPGASIEQWIAAAGMEWNILRARVRYAISRDASNDPASYKAFDGRCVFLRSDTKEPLGIGSDKFRLVQPRATIEFFRDLVGAAGGNLSTAGTLFGGSRFWAMATFGEDSTIADKRDRIRRNLLLATACDGTMATSGKWIAERVVCNNTLQIGLGEMGRHVKISHRTTFDAKAVKAELGIEQAQSAFDKAIGAMRQLAETKLSSDAMLRKTVFLLHPEFDTYDGKQQTKVLKSKPVDMIGRLAIDQRAMGAEYTGASGTAWGWLNAVTEYVDHAARAQSVDNRLNSAWFGKGAEVKERAFAMAGNAEPAGRLGAVDSINAWLAGSGVQGDEPDDSVL